MGLFDKLKEAVGNAIESSMNGPMNEDEKKYYDIVLNLLLCIKRLQKQHVQKFIEVKYNENCDDATLCKVLEKFEAITEPKTNGTWYQLTSTQSSRADYKDGGLSWFNKEEIGDICFASFVEEISSKFSDIFEVVKEQPSKDILDQGISKIIITLPTEYPDYGDYSYYQMAIKVIGQEIINLFYDGDCLIRDILSNSALSCLEYDYEHEEYEYLPHLYAFALRALHYEKSDKTAENYISITKADCCDAVENAQPYQDEIKEKPFDKEDIIKAAVEAILNSCIITAPSKTDWMHWVIQDVRLVDAACFFAWKEIVAKTQETADNAEDATDIIHGYLENAEEYEDSENTAVYNMIPDDVRSRLKPVDNDD